jgi:ATP-dependent RNA helicase DDX24/MAK5
MKLDFRDEHPVVVDLSPEGGIVSTFQESKIECLSADKVLWFTKFTGSV